MKECETFINEFTALCDKLFSKDLKYVNEQDKFSDLLIPVKACKVFRKIFDNNNDLII